MTSAVGSSGILLLVSSLLPACHAQSMATRQRTLASPLAKSAPIRTDAVADAPRPLAEVVETKGASYLEPHPGPRANPLNAAVAERDRQLLIFNRFATAVIDHDGWTAQWGTEMTPGLTPPRGLTNLDTRDAELKLPISSDF